MVPDCWHLRCSARRGCGQKRYSSFHSRSCTRGCDDIAGLRRLTRPHEAPLTQAPELYCYSADCMSLSCTVLVSHTCWRTRAAHCGGRFKTCVRPSALNHGRGGDRFDRRAKSGAVPMGALCSISPFPWSASPIDRDEKSLSASIGAETKNVVAAFP